MINISPVDLATLHTMPTLSEGQDCDLKIDTGKIRVWVTRMTDADAEDYRTNGHDVPAIGVERYDGYRWSDSEQPEADLATALRTI